VTKALRFFEVEMAAPGLTKNDFKIEVNQGILKISSEKREEAKPKPVRMIDIK